MQSEVELAETPNLETASAKKAHLFLQVVCCLQSSVHKAMERKEIQKFHWKLFIIYHLSFLLFIIYLYSNLKDFDSSITRLCLIYASVGGRGVEIFSADCLGWIL